MAITTATDSGHVLDMARHAGEEIPDAAIPKPQVGSAFEIGATVLKGMLKYRPSETLKTKQSSLYGSIACSWNQSPCGLRLWNVALGQNC